MEKIVVDLEVKSNKGVKDVKDLNKEISNTKTEAKGASDSLDKVSGGAIGKFNGLKGSIGGVVKGFKSLKFAIIASGIGALLLAVVAVGKAFTSSEEGQNKFAKIMGVIGSVTGNLVDMLANLGENLISVFENPKQAIIDLKNLIVENITNRFEALIDTVGFLGSAFKKVFSGDFSGAMDDAKKAGSSYVDTLTGVKDTLNKVTEGVKEMSNEIAKDARAASKIADQRANADRLDRKLITERAEANRKRAELLDKAAQKEKFTAAERIKFLEDAGKIEDDITAKEIRAAQLRYEAKVVENSLSKSTKEDLDKEAELKAKLINLETAKLTKQKLVSSQVVGAKREEAAEIKAIEDKAIADRKAIEELEANTEEEKRALKLQKEKEKFESAILLATEQGISTQELERSQEESLQLMRDEFAQTDLDREAKREADKKVIDDKAVADAKLISDAKIEIARREQDAKSAALNGYASALSSVSNVVGQETQKGKALAIASSLVNTYAAITGQLKAFSGVPVPGYAIAQAVATGVAGFANVKKIASVKVPNSSGGGSVPSGGGGSAPVPAPSLPPAFNVVGASGASANQLQSVITGQSQQPIRTYVVSDDVSTSQQLDRNIIAGATI
jgi:hypothetical protein